MRKGSQLLSMLLVILLAASLAIGCVSMVSGDELKAPWSKVKEYALKGEKNPNGCYVKEVENKDKGTGYAFVYCPEDDSLAVFKREGQHVGVVCKGKDEQGKDQYVVGVVTMRQFLIVDEEGASKVVFGFFQEMVSGTLI